RIEEEEARMLGVDHRREPGQARQLLANFGHELPDARSSGAELHDELRRSRSAHETTDHLHPWPEGGRAFAFECASPEDGHATIGREVSAAIRKARLADARLAREEEERAPTSPGGFDRSTQLADLALATDEHASCQPIGCESPRIAFGFESPRIRGHLLHPGPFRRRAKKGLPALISVWSLRSGSGEEIVASTAARQQAVRPACASCTRRASAAYRVVSAARTSSALARRPTRRAVFPALIGHRAREPLISAEDGPSSSRGKRGPAARRRRTGRTVVSRRPEGEDTLLSVAARNRQPLSRLQLTVQVTAASSRYSPSVNRRDAARTFSSRCSIEEVP